MVKNKLTTPADIDFENYFDEIPFDGSGVTVGRSVPDMSFDAYHQDSIKKLSLARFLKKWLILFFYPADFTFVCPTELEELADLYAEFTKEGADIVSVSTDTVHTHKAWHDISPAVRKITFPMAADPNHRLTRLFGVYIEDEGVARRGTFLIDPDGILRATTVHDDAIGRNARELLRVLRAAKFVRSHEGNVCPASWEPGAKTLKKGLNLVGKI